jgi:hypothetical protein
MSELWQPGAIALAADQVHDRAGAPLPTDSVAG